MAIINSLLFFVTTLLGGTILGILAMRKANDMLLVRGIYIPQMDRDSLQFSEKNEIIIIGIGMLCALASVLYSRDIFTLTYKLMICYLCLLLSITDAYSRRLPIDANIGIFVVWLAFALFRLLGVNVDPKFSLISSAAGIVAMFLIFLAPKFLTKATIGRGDIIMVVSMGALLGLGGSLLATVLMGFGVLGYMYISARDARVRYLKQVIPMGPAIATGITLVSVFRGVSIL